jgi:hypothetical protein
VRDWRDRLPEVHGWQDAAGWCVFGALEAAREGCVGGARIVTRGALFFLGLVRLQLQSGCGVFCGNFFHQAWCDLGCNWALLGVKCVGGCKNHVLVIGYCWHTQLGFHEIREKLH